jgi:SAM-dependent methyltransferase
MSQQGEKNVSGSIDFGDPAVALSFARTGSPYAYYAKVFDLPVEPSVILDLGCGAAAKFARAPENRHNIVISLSPHLGYFSLLQIGISDLFLQAKAQNIPLKSNSVDRIVSANAVPLYIPSAERPFVYSESVRVLKPGGTAQFYPFFEEEGDNSLAALKDKAAALAEMIDDPLAFRFPTELVGMLEEIIPKQQLPRLTLTKFS